MKTQRVLFVVFCSVLVTYNAYASSKGKANEDFWERVEGATKGRMQVEEKRTYKKKNIIENKTRCSHKKPLNTIFSEDSKKKKKVKKKKKPLKQDSMIGKDGEESNTVLSFLYTYFGRKEPGEEKVETDKEVKVEKKTKKKKKPLFDNNFFKEEW